MRASTRTVEHVGEWRVEVRAGSLRDVFAELARVIARASGRAAGPPGKWENLFVEARDADGLLVDFANELVGRGEIARRAYDELRDVAVSVKPPRVHARVRGRAVPVWRSPLKAATYHGARLWHDNGTWRATLLFDV